MSRVPRSIARVLTIAIVSSSAVMMAGCDVYRSRSVIVDERMQPGWAVIEYGNKRCPSAGIFTETIRLSNDGFACTASNLPVAFNWTCKRRKGDALEELVIDRDYNQGITITQPGRKFLLFRYTPDRRPVPDNPGDAVARYLKAEPWTHGQ